MDKLTQNFTGSYAFQCCKAILYLLWMLVHCQQYFLTFTLIHLLGTMLKFFKVPLKSQGLLSKLRTSTAIHHFIIIKR